VRDDFVQSLLLIYPGLFSKHLLHCHCYWFFLSWLASAIIFIIYLVFKPWTSNLIVQRLIYIYTHRLYIYVFVEDECQLFAGSRPRCFYRLSILIFHQLWMELIELMILTPTLAIICYVHRRDIKEPFCFISRRNTFRHQKTGT